MKNISIQVEKKQIWSVFALVSIKSTLLFSTITVSLKMAFNRMPGTRLGSTSAWSRMTYRPADFWQRSSFSPCLSHRFSIMNTREERRLARLVSCRAKVCIQSRRSEGLQYDIKRSISRMAIASLRRKPRNTHALGALSAALPLAESKARLRHSRS